MDPPYSQVIHCALDPPCSEVVHDALAVTRDPPYGEVIHCVLHASYSEIMHCAFLVQQGSFHTVRSFIVPLIIVPLQSPGILRTVTSFIVPLNLHAVRSFMIPVQCTRDPPYGEVIHCALEIHQESLILVHQGSSVQSGRSLCP